MASLLDRTRWVIIGAGFAGASTAWAIGRAGLGPGVILEQETTYGFHASGRNAALLRMAEAEPVVLALLLRSAGHIRQLDRADEPLVRPTGGLTLVGPAAAAELQHHHDMFLRAGLETTLLSAAQARSRFPLLHAVQFDTALWCPSEGIVDIHALLTLYLHLARDRGVTLSTGHRAEGLLVEAGRVTGVHTSRGDVRADIVIDASGAWAGRLGRSSAALPLQPLRRHLFMLGAPAGGHHDCPFTWMEDAGFYFRPEGDGLLCSPCDETPMPPCDPPTDPAAADLLAEKLARDAPAFADLPLRRSWACLRTFTPDRRPLVGPDPDLAGLFHVSGLGGFGVGTSAAIGELASLILSGRSPDWIDRAAVDPNRLR
jgi:D-arginine dehydrogenase